MTGRARRGKKAPLRDEYQIVETTPGFGNYVYGDPITRELAESRVADNNAYYARFARTWEVVKREITDWHRVD